MRSYLVISAIVFGAVAFVHLLRLMAVPLWTSVVGLLAPGGLCIWALALARGRRAA